MAACLSPGLTVSMETTAAFGKEQAQSRFPCFLDKLLNLSQPGSPAIKRATAKTN